MFKKSSCCRANAFPLLCMTDSADCNHIDACIYHRSVCLFFVGVFAVSIYIFIINKAKSCFVTRVFPMFLHRTICYFLHACHVFVKNDQKLRRSFVWYLHNFVCFFVFYLGFVHLCKHNVLFKEYFGVTKVCFLSKTCINTAWREV